MKRSKAALKINWARLVTVLFFDHAVFGLKYDMQNIRLKSREAKRLGSVKVRKLSGSTARKFSDKKFMKRSKAALKINWARSVTVLLLIMRCSALNMTCKISGLKAGRLRD
jgi:hypothetical protein